MTSQTARGDAGRRWRGRAAVVWHKSGGVPPAARVVRRWVCASAA